MREDDWPIKSGQIAEAQDIPPRFLENILAQLRQGGFIASKRGKEGGYMLAEAGREATVGQVIRFIEGPLAPVHCMVDAGGRHCKLAGDCPFRPLWDRAHQAVLAVYDTTSFRDLIRQHRKRQD
ncbi:MAG: Rrf2 family transcriptional regulator [Armatimonadota bacterium]